MIDGDSPSQPLNKRQQQAAATRDRMLRAAREVFETKGYQAASVATITKAADTAHGTFYLYFKNRDDAFAQVMAEVTEEMRDESRARLADDPSTGDPLAIMDGLIRGVLVVFARHAGLWRALLEGMLQSPAVEQIWLDASGEFQARIAARLEREQQEAAVRPFDASLAAEALCSMTEWYGFRKLVVQRSTPSQEDVDAAVRTVADLWFHAIYGSVR